MAGDTWVQLTTLVTCDQPLCGHPWRPRVRIVRDRAIGEDWHFRCPRCSHRYDLVHISPRGVEVREELGRVRVDTEMEAEAREARIAELMAKMERETTNYRAVPGEEASDGGGDDTPAGGRGPGDGASADEAGDDATGDE